jgi:hypothetical protein
MQKVILYPIGVQLMEEGDNLWEACNDLQEAMCSLEEELLGTFNEETEICVDIYHSKRVMYEELQEKRSTCFRRLEELRTDVEELTEQFQLFSETWGEREEEAAWWDMDHMVRFGGPVTNELEQLEKEFHKVISDGKETLDKLQRDFEEIKNDAECIIQQHDDLKFIKVYRLLREDEDPDKGLHAKNPTDYRTSIAEHIESGSWKNSRFISASKSFDVCLFYASKAIHDRGSKPENLRIVEIELDLSAGDVIDLSGNYEEASEQRLDAGIEAGSTADNYAKIFEEVNVDRSITPSEIERIYTIGFELPRATRFSDFSARSGPY